MAAGASTRWHLRGQLLPEDKPVELWVADGCIVDGPISGAAEVSGLWIMPGFVDAHCHIGLCSTGGTTLETAREQAATDRDGGTLLIRDAGSPIDTHPLADDQSMPRIIRAGRHIARPRRYIRGYAVEIEQGQLTEEVARQVQSGDGWVKLIGDWIDRDAGDLAPLWEKAEAAEAISRAHELGARVTAHCFGEQSVADLVDAGIDCIEHATGASDEVLEQMARQQVALVPTLINIENFGAIADAGEQKFPRYAAHMRALYRRNQNMVQAAIEAGIQIYAGTDAGGTVKHGRITDEIVALAALGGADFALGAGSWRAREWLGAARLEVGAPADLVACTSDPRGDVRVIGDLDLVMLNGERYK